MKKLLNTIAIFTLLMTSILAYSLAANPGQAQAASSDLAAKCSKHHPFLGLKPWYAYIGNELDDGSKDSKNLCSVKCFNLLASKEPNECGQKGSDVPLVLLAIADDLLRIAGLVALGFVFVGAFKYVGSQGSPEGTAKAQETIINALIGLVLALSAVAIVSFLGNSLGK